MAWSTPRTWAVGELLTAANMNTYLSNELSYIHGDSGAVDFSAGGFSYTFGGSVGSTTTAGSLYVGTSLTTAGGTTGSVLTAAGGTNFVRASNAASLLRASLTADSQYRFTADFNGLLSWGPGGASGTDTSLARTASGTLTVTSNLVLAGSGNLTISTGNIITDTSTGTKIGTATTQKLGFFNATPVAQQASGIGSNFTAGAGTAMNSASTSTGGTGASAFTFGDIVRALKNLGLIAA